MANRALCVYLNDHLMGATFGVQMFRRAARGQTDAEARAVLTQLAEEVDDDRRTLIDIMSALGVPRRHYKVLAGGIAERVGRLKLNGSLVSRAPTSDLVELEALYLGVTGKVACWEALQQLASAEPALDPDQLEILIRRGTGQADKLEELRQAAARRAWQAEPN